MKDAYYFSHDSNARHDYKIQALRSIYGVKGYGMYWIVIEMMRDSDEYKLPINQKLLFIALSREFECTPDEAKKFIYDCIYDFALFISDEEYFWSDSLLRRMDSYARKVEIKKANGNKGGRPPKNQTEAAQADVIAENTEGDKPKKEKRVKTENATIAQDEPVSGTVSTLTDFLIRKMKSNNAQAKIPNDLKKWHDAIRLMMDADGYTEQQVSEMIDFSQKDGFWKANILSATKLREKAGTLILQMGRGTDAKSRASCETATGTDSGYKINGSVSPERIAELLEKKRKREEENLRMQQVSG